MLAFRRASARAFLIASALALTTAGAAFAQTAETVVEIDVPSQSLSAALSDFSRQTGVQIVAAPEDVADETAPAASGTMTAAEALGMLIEHAGLVAEFENGTAVLRPALASAQTGPLAPNDETIVVRGYALQTLRAVEARRQSEQISEFIFADDVGQLPDYNLSDAIRRVSGVNTVFDEDEGRYIAMRGLDADFTYVSVDGASLAASDLGGDLGGGRRVLLEAVPSFVVGSTEIRKSMSANDDAQGIGGQVNLVTRSAYDHDGPFLTFGANVGYYDSTDYPTSDNGPSLRGDFAWSDTFGADDAFGLVVAASYMFKDRDQERSSPGNYTYRDEAGEPVDDPGTDPFAFASPAFIVQRGYANEIQRMGGLVKFEHNRGGALYQSLSLQYFTQIDDEERTGTYPNAGSVVDYDGEFYFVEGSDVTSRVQVWDIEKWVSSVLYKADYNFNDDLSARFRANYSGSGWTEDVPRTAFFTSRDVDYRALPGSDSRSVRFFIDDPDSMYFDPTQFNRFDARHRLDDEREDVYELAGDLFHNVAKDDSGFGFQAGASVRRTKRDFDRDQFRYRQGDDFDLNLSEFLLDDSFIPVQGSLPIYVHDARAVFDLINADEEGDAGQFRLDEGWSQARSREGDFSIEEDIAAVYAMGVHEGPRHRFEAGLRIETTNVTALANEDTITITEVDGEPVTVVEEDRVEREGDYTSVLPSLSFMYDFTDELRLRSAFSETIGRPSFRSISGTVTQRFDEVTGVTEITEGNPNLEPRISRNYDLSLEYYFDGGRSLASAGVFYKDIRNDIFVRTTTSEGGALVVTRPENVETSWLAGLELSFVKNEFDFLPAPLDGFGAAVNLTFIDARINVDEATSLDYRLEQPEFLANASMFYRRGPFEGRVTFNRTGEQPRAVDVETPYLSRWEQTFDQIDANIDYDISDRLRLRIQGRNLTNEERIINEGPGRSQIWDYSSFGPQYWIGLTYRN